MNQSIELALKAFVAYAVIHTLTGFTLSPAVLLVPVFLVVQTAASVVPFIFTEAVAIVAVVCSHWIKIALMSIMYYASDDIRVTTNILFAAFVAVVLDHAFTLHPALAYIGMVCLFLALRSHHRDLTGVVNANMRQVDFMRRAIADLTQQMDWTRRVLASLEQTVGMYQVNMDEMKQSFQRMKGAFELVFNNTRDKGGVAASRTHTMRTRSQGEPAIIVLDN